MALLRISLRNEKGDLLSFQDVPIEFDIDEEGSLAKYLMHGAGRDFTLGARPAKGWAVAVEMIPDAE